MDIAGSLENQEGHSKLHPNKDRIKGRNGAGDQVPGSRNLVRLPDNWNLPLAFFLPRHWGHRRRDRARDLVLDREDVFHITVEHIRPLHDIV